MNENYFQFQNAYLFMRHSTLMPNRKTLLFIHGVGDSGLNYLSFFKSPLLNQFNILVPDLLGHGKSSGHNDYPFHLQCAGIINHLKYLEDQNNINFDHIVLIAHSMGGIHAMYLCQTPLKNKIKEVINVEGSITQYGSFISEKVSQVYAEGQFDSWFQHFKEVMIFDDFIKKFPICRTYYASLEFCHPLAFLQNSLEMRQIAITDAGKYTNSAGNYFAKLNLPKIYCYGDQSLCAESIDFIHEHKIPNHVFKSKNHFLMQECFDEFAPFLANHLSKK